MKLPYGGPLCEDAQGNLWIGSSSQLMRWHDGSFDSYFREQLERYQGLNSVESIVADGASVWAAIPREGLGLIQIVDGVAKKSAFRGINSPQVGSLWMDRDHSLWMGTSNDGVYRLYGDRVDHFRSEDGLSSNAVNGFFEDREGNLWVSTSKGLDCFRDTRVVTFSTSEGLAADLVSSVLASEDGTVWIGNRWRLDRLTGDKVSSIPIPARRVTSLWQDHAGRLWIGVDDLLTIYDRGQFKRVNRRDGSPLGTAVAITEDREQNIWVSVVGAVRKLFRIHDMRVEDEFTPDQIPFPRLLAADPTSGIWLGLSTGDLGRYRNGKLETFRLQPRDMAVSGLTIDADGTAWASTRSGIAQWRNGEVKKLSSQNGLPCDEVFSTIRDRHANLWIYAKCGLLSIADSELERWRQQPDRRVQYQILDVFDGVIPGPSTFQPAVSKSPDGRLWFVNDAGLQMIDPDRLQKNITPPPVYVEEVRADRKVYRLGGLVRLPARSRDIEIGYTALSFSVPQKVRFRYRLDGRDQDWQDAGNRRQVFYTDLAPGRYRFHVMASNNDGVWNEVGAMFDFSVDAAYYQTRWFQALCSTVLLAAILAVYRYRLGQIAREFNLRLQERVNERTRIARDLHDTLLQSFQGLILRLQVVDDLLPEGTAKAELEKSLERADQAIAEGRSVVHDLRSSVTTANDLPESLRTLGEELAAESTAACRLVMDGAPRDLQPTIRDEIYRIAREALRNAVTHAGARNIETEVAYTEREFRLRIRDDGQGIPSEILGQGRPGHYGLSGMRERAKQFGGKLEIWSGAGTGTEIELTIAGSIAYGASTSRPRFRLFRKEAGGV
jgi:signal transduction histidine kinase/streptogramin lyase